MNELAAPSPETGSTERANFGYRLVRKFLSFWINRFFRDVEIHRASDVQKGPVIFVINHPNNLIDTFLVSYTIKRKIHYLATAQMFRNKILSLFLHNMGIIPVYRKQDDSAYADKNVSTFQDCFKVLNNGGAIGIYPEGVTHAERRVRKIKTGAARIALEAEDHYHPGILLVPVGLNYSARKSFRSEVIVNIGKPIPASDYELQYRSDPVTAVDRLTSDLQKAMEDQVVVEQIDGAAQVVRQDARPPFNRFRQCVNRVAAQIKPANLSRRRHFVDVGQRQTDRQVRTGVRLFRQVRKKINRSVECFGGNRQLTILCGDPQVFGIGSNRALERRQVRWRGRCVAAGQQQHGRRDHPADQRSKRTCRRYCRNCEL